MTTLSERPHAALLVIDVQNKVMSEVYDRDAVVANIAKLVDHARTQNVPVVWVQDSDDNLPMGSDGWQFIPELKQADEDPIVHKQYADAFEESNLEETLANLAIGRLVVSGAQTDECIRATLHGAVVRGYDATLVSDAHTTEDLSHWGAPPPDKVIEHTNMYWSGHAAPGRKAGTVTTEEVSFG